MNLNGDPGTAVKKGDVFLCDLGAKYRDRVMVSCNHKRTIVVFSGTASADDDSTNGQKRM